MPRWRWLLAWAVLLLAMKLAAAYWPTHKDAGAWASAIRERAQAPVREVLFVEDMARYGLHLHLGPGTQIEKIALDPRVQARFNPQFDETLAQELDEGEVGAIWVCKEAGWAEIQARIAAQGYRATRLGTPYQRRILFHVAPGT